MAKAGFVAALLLLLAALQLRPIDDLDMFAQLRLGLLQLQGSAPPAGDALTFTLPAVASSPNPGWLAQLLFAWIFSAGGWTLVKLASDLILALGILIPARLFTRGTVDFWAAVLLAFLVIASNTSIRPQVMALLCFSLLVWAINSPRHPLMRGAIICPILWIWQNAHPSLSMGILLLAVDFIATLASRPSRPSRLSFDATLLVLACGFQFLTPEGRALSALAAHNHQIARELLRISEWLPPWNPSVRDAMLGFWISVPAALCFLVFHRRGAPLTASLPFLAFTALSLYSARFAFFLAAAGAGVWGEIGQALRRRFPIPPLKRAALPAMLCAALALLLSARGAATFHHSVPLASIRALRGELPGGRIYNYAPYCGPLALLGEGQWRCVADGRLYLFSEAFWQSYLNEASGNVPLTEMEARYHPDAYLLAPRLQANLIALLQRSPDWKRIYEDPDSVAFVPRR